MRRRIAITSIAAACASGFLENVAAGQHGRNRCAQDHVDWVVETFERMETIKPGMTRADLMQVFTTEGGISTALQRIFVSRDCSCFKVDVKFRRTPARKSEEDSLEEYDDDQIVSVSRPYIDPTAIMD